MEEEQFDGLTNLIAEQIHIMRSIRFFLMLIWIWVCVITGAVIMLALTLP